MKKIIAISLFLTLSIIVGYFVSTAVLVFMSVLFGSTICIWVYAAFRNNKLANIALPNEEEYEKINKIEDLF